MFNKKLDDIKSLVIKKDGKNNKKSIENLIVLAVLLIITIVAINYIWNGENKNKQNNGNSNKILASENIIEESEDYRYSDLELKLKNILSNISGVGNVEVLITYLETSKVNPIYNEDSEETITEEEDTSGGKRTISSTNNKKEVVSTNNNVITQSVTSPQVQGAVIIAQGASDLNVKTKIIQAVEAATGLSTYKIQVFEMN